MSRTHPRTTRSGDLRLGIDGSSLVARLSGEIDMSNAEQLGQRIVDATPADSGGVVLTLTDVSYLDSFGIYVIFGLGHRLAQRGQVLVLVVPHDSPIQPALRLANVSERMKVVQAVDDAMRLLGSNRSAAASPQAE